MPEPHHRRPWCVPLCDGEKRRRRRRGRVRGRMEVPQFESPGLLYAKSTQERHNLDMLKPADEVAEDVLEMFEDGPSHQLSWMEEEEGEGEVDGDWEGEGGGGDTSMRPLLRSNSSRAHRTSLPLHLKDVSSTSLESPDEARPLSPVDPNALRDLELQAKKVASSLDYIMENLHNSLHAVSIYIFMF
ncbi:hypothetical protein GBAR_LOCUS8474 [Geodia barretti]|uniref:Uncharacterized protein n=1 Tax=Geodia barretti TaxID=519541 RepID=A0AA35RKR0_GEOBA|nr:hypothetical protein GBAR_LOCUS8474 [Geodia barretti]